MNFIQRYSRIATTLSLLFLVGCAHHIQVNPSVDDIRGAPGIETSASNVGYYIPEQELLKEVKTPGGGGDSVTYEPYQDAEPALNAVLSKKFNRVYSIKSLEETAYIEEKNLQYIFLPTITTDSSSSNVMMWPPSTFEVMLECKVVDPQGNPVWETAVTGNGEADFSEYSKDFGIAGRRAMEDAFMLLLQALDSEETFN